MYVDGKYGFQSKSRARHMDFVHAELPEHAGMVCCQGMSSMAGLFLVSPCSEARTQDATFRGAAAFVPAQQLSSRVLTQHHALFTSWLHRGAAALFMHGLVLQHIRAHRASRLRFVTASLRLCQHRWLTQTSAKAFDGHACTFCAVSRHTA